MDNKQENTNNNINEMNNLLNNNTHPNNNLQNEINNSITNNGQQYSFVTNNNQDMENKFNQNNNIINNAKQNNQTIKIIGIIAVIIIGIFLLMKMFSGNNSSIPNNEINLDSESVATLYIEDLYNNSEQEELLTKYKGKKISLVGTFRGDLTNGFSGTFYKGFTAVCSGTNDDDIARLNLQEGDIIKMTGILKSYSINNSWTLSGCTVTK